MLSNMLRNLHSKMSSKVARQSASPAVLSLAQFRHQRLVSVVKPSWLISLSVKVATLLKMMALLGQKGMAETAVAVASTAAHFLSLSLPMIVVWAHHLELLTPALAAVHLLRSVLCIYCATDRGSSQFAESLEAVKRPLALQAELVAELFFGFQDQMSLPIMAVLHALRQVAWMSVLVWRMDATPLHGVFRGFCNWVVMMLVSWFWEMRLQAAYKKHCQQQLPELPHPASILPFLTPPTSEQFVCHLTSADKPSAQVGSGAQQAHRMCSCPYPSTSQHCAQPDAGSSSDLLVYGLSDCVPSCPDDLSAASVVRPEHMTAAMHVDTPGLLSFKAALQRKQDVSPTDQADHSAHNGSLQPALAGAIDAQPSSQLGHQSRTALHAMVQQRKQPYIRNKRRMGTTVSVKLDGIELDQMPAELPRLMHEQLRRCMPGVTMTGLALRSGCVMMTLDLESGEDDGGLVDTVLAGSMTDLINRLMQGHALGQVLEDGATMRIQAAGDVAFYRWDSSTSSYASDRSAGSVGVWELGLTSCRMLSVMPAVHCLPEADGDRSPASYQLSLTVKLQLPSTCQLHGWHPGDVAAPAGAGQLLQEGRVVDAILLARRLDGDYLPVVVEHVGASSDDATTQPISVQVIVATDASAPGTMRLELWCKPPLASSFNGSRTEADASYQPNSSSPPVGLDLLVAYVPLLVLPGSWKEAAAELEQHIKDLGGVQPWHAVPALASSTAFEPASNTSDTAIRDLLEDLGDWLAHHSGAVEHVIAGQPATALGTDMSQLGNDLLVYAVQHSLGVVAERIVNMMQRGERLTSITHGGMQGPHDGRSDAEGDAERSGPASGPSAWLVLATHGSGGADESTGMSLLHAAMASGNPDILAQVLRWGTLYGGPDWAWPWELEDAAGCTALHLAAAQPVAGACAALLKTIACMLPTAQRQAARNTWLHCQGRLGATPAELASDSGNTVGSDWLDIDQDPSPTGTGHMGPVGDSTALADATEDPTSGPSTSGAADIQQAENVQMPLQSSFKPQSWLSAIVEVWTTWETDEYYAWVKQQMAGVVFSWATAMVFLAVVSFYRLLKAGCNLHDLSDVCLHTAAYIPLAAATRGCLGLGNWQSWMVSVHVFHCVAHMVKLTLSQLRMAVVTSSMAGGADIVYIMVLTAVLDQTPLHTLLVARTVQAFCHGLVYKAIHVFPSPFRRAFIVHGIALLVTTLARARQLRAYRRWQAAQESQGKYKKE